MEFLNGKKTMIFGMATMLLPILEMREVTNIIPDEYTNVYMIGIAVVTMLLRIATNSKIKWGK